MSTIRFRRFTKPQFLKQIGRPLLAQLWGKFASDLAARGVTLPAETLADEEYFTALARVTLTPEALPDNLIEALVAIEELATAEGQERLETAVIRAGLELTFREESSHGDIAVQVYLAQPALLVAQHNETRLGRLTAFDYFGSQPGGTRQTEIPTRETLDLLARDLDVWFGEHNRGARTTRIEMHVIEGEFHFMVRHGDTFTRTAKVENERLEVMHFRPAKDDVVVYTPKRDEIRVHAGTKGEKELYRRAFGQRLFGDAEHFSERKAYTGEPLREDGAAALDSGGLPGVVRIVLREAELAWGRDAAEYLVRGGTDLGASARARGRDVIPEYGTIARAVFDFHFSGQKKARRVELRMPNTVKLGRGCDPRVVHEWLSARGFRVNANEVAGGGCEGSAGEVVTA